LVTQSAVTFALYEGFLLLSFRKFTFQNWRIFREVNVSVSQREQAVENDAEASLLSEKVNYFCFSH
jgi:hypothetical protein